MSKNETRQESKDAFSVYRESANKMFDSVKQSVPQYHQSITNVQQEYLQVFENLVYAGITMQKDFVRKAGIAASVPDATGKIVRDTTAEFVKVISLQNQIALATIDATQQTVKTFNDNAKSFSDLNRNIIQSWTSAFTPRNN